MAKDNKPHTEHDRKPFMRLKIFGEVYAKGVGFTAKKSVMAFMGNHGFEAKFSDVAVTSDYFEGILEIYDNGRIPDFNVSALYEHLRVSGMLPSQESMRPNLKIVPLPCDFVISEVSSSGHEGCQRTMDGLNLKLKGLDSRLGDQERVITNLTATLEQRQTVLGAKEKTIADLELRITRTAPVQYDDPALSVVNGCLVRGAEYLFDASEDFDALAKSNNLAVFGNSQELSYVEFVNSKYGLKFEKEDDVNEWMQKMRTIKSPEDLPEYRDVNSQRKQFDVNKSILQIAKEQGASPEIINAIEKSVGESETRVQALDESLRKLESQYAAEIKVFEAIKQPEQDYKQFKAIVEQSNARRAPEKQLIFLADVKEGNARVYFPFIGGKIGIDAYVRDRVSQLLSARGLKAVYKEGSGSFAYLELEYDKASRDGIEDSVSSVVGDLEQNKVLQGLGLNPKAVVLSN